MNLFLLLATLVALTPVRANPLLARPTEPSGNRDMPPMPKTKISTASQLDPSWEWFKDQTGMYGIKWDGWKDGRYGNRYAAVSDLSEGIGGRLLAVGVNCQAFKIAWNQDDGQKKAWTAWEYPISRSVSEQIMLKLCDEI
jgi:hypothetical protein